MVKPLEHSVEQTVVDWALLAHGLESIKLNLSGNVGWPDRMFLHNGGQTLWIEFKREGEPLKPLQEYRLEWLINHGFRCGWCDNVDDGKRIIESWLKSLPHGNNSLK